MHTKSNNPNYDSERLQQIKKLIENHQLGKALVEFEQYKGMRPNNKKIDYYDDLFKKLVTKSNPNYTPELLIAAYKELKNAYDKGEMMVQNDLQESEKNQEYQGNIEEVIPHFSELLKNTPYDKVTTIMSLAREYKKTNNPDIARNILLRASSFKNNDYILLDLIKLDLKMNNIEEAKYCIKTFPRPIENNEVLRTLSLLKGQAAIKEEKYRKALSVLKSKLGSKKDSIYWDTQYEIARVYLKQNKIEQAVLISSEIEQNKGVAQNKLLFLKARIDNELGKKQESLKCYKEILSNASPLYKEEVKKLLNDDDYLTIAALASRDGHYYSCKQALSQIDDKMLDKIGLENLKRIRFYLDYKACKEQKPSSYFEKQLINYSEDYAIKHIEKHFSAPANVNITKRIERLIDAAKISIQEEEPWIDGMTDKYVISPPSIIKTSRKKPRLLEVTTLPNTDLILTMHIIEQPQEPIQYKKI